MDLDEETAVVTAAAATKAPNVHSACCTGAWALAWAVASPFIAAALFKYCVAAAVTDAARLGVFLLPMCALFATHLASDATATRASRSGQLSPRGFLALMSRGTAGTWPSPSSAPFQC